MCVSGTDRPGRVAESFMKRGGESYKMVGILETWLFSLEENFAKMLARHFSLGKFSRYYSYFLHKGILFSRGGNFREEDKSPKYVKITPTQKFPGFTVHGLKNEITLFAT